MTETHPETEGTTITGIETRYPRLIATWREMPVWLNWLLSAAALGSGWLVSAILGNGAGARVLLFAVVAGGIEVGAILVWRVTRRRKKKGRTAR